MGKTLLDACRRLTTELGGNPKHYASRKPGGAS
jgi:hypothetical protein